jgi:nicotinamide-nucleotide amidase
MTGAGPAAAVATLRVHNLTVGTAESLTGGLVCAALTEVPGASAVVRGAVVSYAIDVKASVLGVDAGLLASQGAVHPEVASQMALGACRVLGCDVGVATTGVAGPHPADGRPVGTVYVAVATPTGVHVRELALGGDRTAVRSATVDAALALLVALVG